MLDIALIREKPEWVKEQIAKLYDDEAAGRIDTIVQLDQQRRTLLGEVEEMKANRNKLSKATGKLKGNKKLATEARIATAQAVLEAMQNNNLAQAVELINNPDGNGTVPAEEATDDAFNTVMQELFARMKGLSDQISELDDRVREVDQQLQENLLWIPNLPHESVPVAESDDENIPGEPSRPLPAFDFTPQPHWDLGPALGIIDFERGVKLGGTRFYILAGVGARLQRALINFLMDTLTEKEGFQEMYMPLMVKEDAMYGSGQFPKFVDTSYKIEDTDSYMLPTSEVAIANMFSGEVLEEDQLPLYYMGHTPCFRREKMSAGRDTRGIKRVHQFEKVEMFKFATPETSYDELEKMMQTAESLLDALELPHRRLEIVTGDLGFTATKKFDIEVYAPGSDEWLEVSSCSNTENYQARRANIKYRPNEGKNNRFVHLLNGSALGIPRTLIAIMENYQNADGSIRIPTVLQPYMGGIEVIESH